MTENGINYIGFTEYDQPLPIPLRNSLKEFDFKFLLKQVICNPAGRHFERLVLGNDNYEMAFSDRVQITHYTDDYAIKIFELFQDEINTLIPNRIIKYEN